VQCCKLFKLIRLLAASAFAIPRSKGAGSTNKKVPDACTKSITFFASSELGVSPYS